MNDDKEVLQRAMINIDEDKRVPVNFKNQYDVEGDSQGKQEEEEVKCVVCNSNIEGNPILIYNEDDYNSEDSYICDSCLRDSNKYYECEKENCDVVFDIDDTEYDKQDVKFSANDASLLLCPDCQYIADERYGEGHDNYASCFED